jgi:hypothetical protein
LRLLQVLHFFLLLSRSLPVNGLTLQEILSEPHSRASNGEALGHAQTHRSGSDNGGAPQPAVGTG